MEVEQESASQSVCTNNLLVTVESHITRPQKENFSNFEINLNDVNGTIGQPIHGSSKSTSQDAILSQSPSNSKGDSVPVHSSLPQSISLFERFVPHSVKSVSPVSEDNISPNPRKNSSPSLCQDCGLRSPNMESLNDESLRSSNHASGATSLASSPQLGVNDLDSGCRVVVTVPNSHKDGWDSGIVGLAISRSLEYVITCGRYDGKIRFWNADTGHEFDSFEVDHEVLVEDPVENRFDAISQPYRCGSRTPQLRNTGSSIPYSKSCTVEDDRTGLRRGKKEPPTQICCLALAPNDSFILVGCNSSLIYAWDIKTKQRLLIDGRKGFSSHDRRSIEVIAIANNMEYFVHGDDHGVISTWRMTNQCKLKIDPEDKDSCLVLGMRFNNFSLTPNMTSSISISTSQSRIFAVVNQRVSVWEYFTGKNCCEDYMYEEKADACIISGDGQVFVTRFHENDTSFIRCMETSNWEKIITIECCGSRVCSFSLSWDGALLVTGHDDGTVILWDMIMGEQVLQHNLQGKKSENAFNRSSNLFVFISPDGSMIAAGNGRTGILKIWNTTFADRCQAIDVLDSNKHDAAWNMETRFSCRLNESIIVAKDNDGTENLALFRIDADAHLSHRSYRVQSLHRFKVVDLKACSLDGRLLIVTDSSQNLMLWETITNELTVLETDFLPFNIGDKICSKVILSGNGEYVFVYYFSDDRYSIIKDTMVSNDGESISVVSNTSDDDIVEPRLCARVYKWTIFDNALIEMDRSKQQGSNCSILYDKVVPYFDGCGVRDVPFQSCQDGSKLILWSSEDYGCFLLIDAFVHNAFQVIHTRWTLMETVALKFGFDGKYVLFGNVNTNMLTVYHVESSLVVHQVKHEYREILRMSDIARDNSVFITVSDNLFTIWDLKTGCHLHDIGIPSTKMAVRRVLSDGDTKSEAGDHKNNEIHSAIGGESVAQPCIEKVTISTDGGHFIMTLKNQQQFRFENIYRNDGYRHVNADIVSLTSIYIALQCELHLVESSSPRTWRLIKNLLSNPRDEKVICWLLLQCRMVKVINSVPIDGYNHAPKSSSCSSSAYEDKVHESIENASRTCNGSSNCDCGNADLASKKQVYCDNVIHYAITMPSSAVGFIKILLEKYPQMAFLKRQGVCSLNEFQSIISDGGAKSTQKAFTILNAALISKDCCKIRVVLEAIISNLHWSSSSKNQKDNKFHTYGDGKLVQYGGNISLFVHQHYYLIGKTDLNDICNVAMANPDTFIHFVQNLRLLAKSRSSDRSLALSNSSDFITGLHTGKSFLVTEELGSEKYWNSIWNLRSCAAMKRQTASPYVLPIHGMANTNNPFFLKMLRHAILEVSDYSALMNEVIVYLVFWKWQRVVRNRLYLESVLFVVFACAIFINSFYFDEFFQFQSSQPTSLASSTSSMTDKIYSSLGIISIVFSVALCIRKWTRDIRQCHHYSRHRLLLFHLSNICTANHFIVNILTLSIIVLQIVMISLYELSPKRMSSQDQIVRLHNDMKCVAAIAMPFLAIEFIFIIQGFPDIGYCLRMLYEVVLEIKILFLLLLVAIVAFTGSFSLLSKSNTRPRTNSLVEDTPSFGEMLLIVFNMIFGAYSVDDFLTNNGTSTLSALLLAFFLFSVVIILLSFVIAEMAHRVKVLVDHIQLINTFALMNLILEYADHDTQ